MSDKSYLADVTGLLAALQTLDCGDNGCDFAQNKHGQRTNGGCQCLSGLKTSVAIEIRKIWHTFK